MWKQPSYVKLCTDILLTEGQPSIMQQARCVCVGGGIYEIFIKNIGLKNLDQSRPQKSRIDQVQS